MKTKKVITETHKECTHCHTLRLHSEYRVTKRNDDGSVKYSSSWCKYCIDEAERIRNGARKRPVPTVLDDAKECLECHLVLPLDKFSPSSRGRLGKSSYCKSCSNSRVKQDEDYREKHREYVRVYREKHLYRWRAMHRIHQFNRRSKVKATDDGTLTPEVVELLYRLVICYWCGKHTTPDERTLEHIQELSAGGAHSFDNIAMACKSCNFSRKGKSNGRSKGAGECGTNSEGQHQSARNSANNDGD